MTPSTQYSKLDYLNMTQLEPKSQKLKSPVDMARQTENLKK